MPGVEELHERAVHRVRLHVDDGAFPVWWPDEVETADRPRLSSGLVRQITSWAEEWDLALSGNTAHMSGVRARLCHEERRLASVLASELGPAWEVVYFDTLLGREATTMA